MVIRELTHDDDLGAVFTLCREFFREYQRHHEDYFNTDNLTDDDISGRIKESLDSDTSATIVAVIDDKIVGYASLAVRDNPRFYKVKRVGSVSALMIDRHHRRKGIGRRIMQACAAYFRERDIRYFTFFTAIANEPALRLYEGMGMTALHISYLADSQEIDPE